APTLALVEEARGLDAPVGVEFRPGDPGRLYVPEQAGRVRVIDGGRARRRPFLDLRHRVRGGGERGLLGLAFAPDHARSGVLYVHYTDRRGDTRVVRYRARGGRVDPASARRLLAVRQPYENHKGGQLAFGPDGRLYLGLGDGGSAFDPGQRGQSLRTPLGKLLRLDVRRPGARWQIVAYGLRNPWRFSFDREGGDLWIADVGQDRVEEINLVPASERGLVNFGWGAFEGRLRQPRRRLNRRGRLAFPIAAYGRRQGCSVIGGFVYRGTALPALRGRYVYGDLCSGSVWSLARRGGRAQVRRERVRLPLLTSFGQDPRGELHATTHDGHVFRLVKGKGPR
nr:PQQ-dependent sugar dehydrogenase [Actinomycetota bacterium]